MQYRYNFYFVPIFILLLILTPKAEASCSSANGWNSRPLIFNFPLNFVIPVDLPFGSVFYETEVSENHNGENYALCIGKSERDVKYINGWIADSNGIAQTNIPGVGIRIHWIYDGHIALVPKEPYAITWGPILLWNKGPRWKLELIKTGRISGGKLQSGDYVIYGVGGALISKLVIAGGGNIMTPSCSLLSPNINVPLGRHLTSEFDHPGSTTSWQSFDIHLNCNQGARIAMRIDATADASSAPGVMQLDQQKGDMAASGVGIQLWYRPGGGSPVVFGRDTYYYTSVYGGAEVVKLQARYYQTGERIIAGKANGTATFTLTYR